MVPTKIIGGLFPSRKPDNVLFLANARCALYILADRLKPPTVWLPDYHCPSMLEAFGPVKFFHVDNKLHACEFAPGPGDLVVFIDYFGWPTDPTAVDRAKTAGAWVAMDMSQAFLGGPNPRADFWVYSPRKFLPVPDGGILVSKDVQLKCKLADQTWWEKTMAAMDHRRDHEKDNDAWYPMFAKAKLDAPVGYYAMSRYSEMIIRSTDVTALGQKQRQNYITLFDALKPSALFQTMPESVVPVGFPMVCHHRDELRNHLFTASIFPPVHWPIDHPLASQIMTLPCDHRYDTHDMLSITRNIKSGLATLHP